MVDANQGWKMPWDTAIPWDFERAYHVSKELEQLNVYWLEEPLPIMTSGALPGFGRKQRFVLPAAR